MLYIKKYYKIFGFGISFLFVFVFLLLHMNQTYYGDSYGYFMMSTEFINQGLGNFKLVLEEGNTIDYLFSVRGYGWPFIIAVLRMLGFKTQIGWLFWWAAFISFGLAYVIPELFETVFKRKGGIISRLIVTAFMLVFWPGEVLYPLSDIPAIIMVCLGILILLKAIDYAKIKQIIGMFSAGLCLGISYYIRTASMLSCMIAVLIILLYGRKEWWRRVLSAAVVVIGIFIMMVPQIIINTECNNAISYKVPISFTTGISELEYYNGVRYFRYETNVSGTHPEINLISEDEMAKTLLERQNLVPEQIGAKQLMVSILRYPLEFLGIFAAKFANSIDARYGEVYLHQLKGMNYAVIILNFIVWFFGIAGLIFEMGKTRPDIKVKSVELKNIVFFLKNYFLIIFACTVPGLLHLAGTHVEPRYLLPIAVFLWQYIGTLCPVKKILSFMYSRIISAAFIFMAFLGCCSAIWNFTFENIPHFSYFYQEEPALISEKNNVEAFMQKADSDRVTGCVNQYEFNEDKKVTLSGYVFIEGVDSAKTKMKIAFVDENEVYFYDINSTERGDVAEAYGASYTKSGFNFSAYLWDLESGNYNVYLILNNGEAQKIFDTLYTISL